jgi:predicted phage-related endonuclease
MGEHIMSQDTKTFQAELLTGIGGSGAGKVLGLDWGCPREYWYRLTRTEPDFPEEQRAEFQRGHLMEPIILQLYQEATGRQLRQVLSLRHKVYKFLMVHRDAVCDEVLDKDGPGDIEFKCVNRFTLRKFKKHGLHESYIVQMQHSLMVSGNKWGSYGILCLDPWEFHHFDVDRDEALIQTLYNKELAFWTMVENGPAPEKLEPADKRCAGCVFRRSCQGDSLAQSLAPAEKGDQPLVENDDSIFPLLRERVELTSIKSEAEEALDEINSKVKEVIGNRYGVKCPGFRAIKPTWTEQSWDTRALNAIYEVAQKIQLEVYDPEEVERLCGQLAAIVVAVVKAKKPPQSRSMLRVYATGD